MFRATYSGKYVSCSGAKIGDKIILTKATVIEGTATLASDQKKTERLP